jgi:hypothetical protein
MRRTNTSTFLVPLLAIYAVLAIAIATNFAVLWRAGELQSIDAIIARQRLDGAIYNALSIGFASYKYAAYRQAQPKIVAIGTSRAMQIRQHFFDAPFYNLGGLTQGPGQANVLADRLLLDKPPAVVVFALDFWTFCAPRGAIEPVRTIKEIFHDGMTEPQRQFLIYRLLSEHRYSIIDFARVLWGPEDSTSNDRIGLGARLGGSGFAADGSIYGNPPDAVSTQRWAGTLSRVAAGSGQFSKDCEVSKTALEQLRIFVARMEGVGTHVVLLFAPLPAAVIDVMRRDGRYGYIDALREALKQEFQARFFDFYDVRQLAPDTEFLDGLHGGEIVYMRMILAMAKRDPLLAPFVDNQDLEAKVNLWAGHTEISMDPVIQKFFKPI